VTGYSFQQISAALYTGCEIRACRCFFLLARYDALMMTQQCSTHLDASATYRCDGCSRLLCDACIEEGHRLLLCRQCGERAMPLEGGAPQVTSERQRERKLNTGYSFRDALLYPLRGLGAYVFFGYVILLVLFRAFSWVPLLGCVVLVFQLLIALILPGFLFKIVRTSAEGDTELPDWPDWMHVGERLAELGSALVISLLSVIPTALLLAGSGCGSSQALGGGGLSICFLAVLAGMAIGLILWIPAFGAVGTYRNGWLGLRIDLHIRAIAATSPEIWRVMGLVVGLLVGSQILGVLFRFMPLLGAILEILIGVYSLILAMHLIGLHFRRNWRVLESIYN